MINFACFVPHPPIAIPAIGKTNLNKISKTINSLRLLSKELEETQPDTIIIISPHSPATHDKFLVGINEKFTSTFEQFGDFTTKIDFSGNKNLAETISKIKAQILTSEQDQLDHGTSVPLYYLLEKYKKASIIPISPCGLDFLNHLDFGKKLFETLSQSKERIAVIASGDLSHAISQDAPAGFSEAGEIFDKKVLTSVKNQDIKSLLNISYKFVESAVECGFRPLLMLLGVIEQIKNQAEILSYEAPFGVGYAVINFKLK